MLVDKLSDLLPDLLSDWSDTCAVEIARPHLDGAEDLGVLDEGESLGAWEDDLQRLQEHPQFHLELSPQPLVSEQVNALVLVADPGHTPIGGERDHAAVPIPKRRDL